MNNPEIILSNRRRYHSISLLRDFSDEEMARDWTLSEIDKREIIKYRKAFRTLIAVQLCAIRLYGRFLGEVNDLSPRIVNYINGQLDLPPSLTITVPDREVTYHIQRKNILDYLGFRKFDDESQKELESWVDQQARQGVLPDKLFRRAETYLFSERIMFPGPSVLERLVSSVSTTSHEKTFEALYLELSSELRQSIDELLAVPEGEQRSYFYKLKEYPPSAKISSLKSYLKHNQILEQIGIGTIEQKLVDSAFQDYMFRMAKHYSAKDLKRFKDHKRYAMMICFILESRKVLLDHLVKLHDQYIMDMCRHSKNAHEKKHREFRKRQKKAIDTMLDAANALLDWPDEQPLSENDSWKRIGKEKLRESMKDLNTFKRLEERGYGDLLVARYPSLRKYFSCFIQLPFAAEQENKALMTGIEIIRKLDSGKMKSLPNNAPTSFVPRDLLRALRDKSGNINRNAWETGLALAMKDALRSGDLYLPQSKQHVSFWDLMLSEQGWSESREDSFEELKQPQPKAVKTALTQQFSNSAEQAVKRFRQERFVEIQNGKLHLKRDDKALIPASVTNLQKAIDVSMPSIRIEQLLMEVDRLTSFCRHLSSGTAAQVKT